MKSILAAAVFAVGTAQAATIESEYDSRSLAPHQAQVLAKVVRQFGYACDSVSAARESSWDDEYTLICNQWRYVYKIKDVGGRVVVEVE